MNVKKILEKRKEIDFWGREKKVHKRLERDIFDSGQPKMDADLSWRNLDAEFEKSIERRKEIDFWCWEKRR